MAVRSDESTQLSVMEMAIIVKLGTWESESVLATEGKVLQSYSLMGALHPSS